MSWYQHGFFVLTMTFVAMAFFSGTFSGALPHLPVRTKGDRTLWCNGEELEAIDKVRHPKWPWNQNKGIKQVIHTLSTLQD